MTITALADPGKVTSAKQPNYTPATEAILREVYGANSTPEAVAELMETLGKSKGSIIAKLSGMKIYVTPAKTTKSGGRIIKKSTLVENIGTKLEISVPSLEKANKADLEKLTAALDEWLGTE